MGGRGAASAAANNSKYKYRGKEWEYGQEYTTVFEHDNIKYVKRNEGAASTPLETSVDPIRKPDGRIYVTISSDNKVRYISFYDENGLKTKTLDLNDHYHYNKDKTINYTKNHAHFGRNHNELGDDFLTKEERTLAAKIMRNWRKFQRSKI